MRSNDRTGTSAPRQPRRGRCPTAVTASLALALALVACGDDNTMDPARMAGSVVQIRSDSGRGTGFAVRAGDRTVIVTAAHVIEDVGELMVVKEQSVGHSAEVARTIYPDVDVLAIDFEHDLAVLEVPHLPADALKPLALDAEHCDAAATGWGYPPTVFTASREQGLTKAALTAIKRVQLDATERLGGVERVLSKGGVEGILFSPVLEPGNSGGPVLDAHGKVVGVVVMKSMAHQQGAAVCAEHLAPLLATAVRAPADPTRDEATELVTTLTTQFLPFATDEGSARAARDFVHPSILGQSRALFSKFLAMHFTAASLGGGDTSGTAKLAALQRSFVATFPGTVERVEQLGERCVSESDGVDMGCLGDLAALPMALSLLRTELGGMTDVRKVTAQGDPRRVSQRPAEYEVPFVVENAERSVTVRLRLRHDHGRLWLMPGEPEASMEKAIATAAQAERDLGRRLVGTWVYEDHGRFSQQGYGLVYSVRHVLEIRGTEEGLVVVGALDEERHWANSDLSFQCNDRNRQATTVRARWHASVVDSKLVLDEDEETVSPDAKRCGWSADKRLILALRDDGRLVIENYGYGDGQGARDVPFTRGS